MSTRRVAGLGLLSLLFALLPASAPVPAAAAPKPPKPPKVSIGDVTVTEKDAAGVVATFTITLKKGVGKRVKVWWATENGSARAPGDFTAARGKVVFKGPAAKQTRTLSVRIAGDDLVEPDETFRVVLTKVRGGKATRNAGTGTIRNDDKPVPVRTLTVVTTGTGDGVVGSDPAGVSCDPDCDVSLPHGTVVTLTADPDAHSEFDGFTGCPTVEDTCTLTLDADVTVSAAFTAVTRTVTVTKQGTGSGTVVSSTVGVDCGDTCAASFEFGSTVLLGALPDEGSTFVGWSGDCTGSDPLTPCSLTMSAHRNVTATFADLPDHDLSVTVAGNGSGSVTSEPTGISCPGDCSQAFEQGSSVTLTAAPSGEGFEFAGWSGDCAGTDLTCEVTISEARAVTATFDDVPTHAVLVTKAGAGSGTVTSSPSGIDCGAVCHRGFFEGTSVTLTATPDQHMAFLGWTGAGCSGTGTCTLSMTQGHEVQATFMPVQHDLAVTKAGTGAGTVTGTVNGVNCGSATCTVPVNHGQDVTLLAAAAGGSAFTGWSGACVGTGNCTVSMTEARSVTATFAAQPTLSVTTSGAGSGSVTSSPAGVDCGSTCSAPFDLGTVVTLTATPASGSSFTGWGGACSGTGECTVTMSQARSVSAGFGVLTHLLTVTKVGDGVGDVTGTGIFCPSDCTQTFVHGSVVDLYANVDTGSTFAGWSGDGCSGTVNPCQVTMDQARSVTATITRNPVTLTVTKAGSAPGTVTGPGISCPGDCTETYAFGTQVELTAAPAQGSYLQSWSGAGCSGSGSTCTVTMNAAKALSATFLLESRGLTVTRAGTGTGTVTSTNIVGISCGADCSQDYEYGQLVTLNAQTGASSEFTGWSGDGCSGSSTTCSVTMDQARTVTATFTSTLRPLTVTRTGAAAGTGSVTSEPAGIDCGSTCTASYAHGTTVTLSASAGGAPAHFGGWSGAGCESAGIGDCTVTMDQARSVEAEFYYQDMVLAISLPDGITGTSVVSDQVGTCTAEEFFCLRTGLTYGEEVVLRQNPGPGTHFVNWAGCDEITAQNHCRLTMTHDSGVEAYFAED